MMADTPPPAAGRQHGKRQPFTVTTYVHHATGSAWLDVAGELSAPSSPRALLLQLRRAHRRLPRGIDVVGVDLTQLDQISLDLAVLLCLESRMLGVRDIKLGVVLRTEAEMAQSADLMLGRLRVWRVGADQLSELSEASAHARLGEQGWEPLVRRTLD